MRLGCRAGIIIIKIEEKKMANFSLWQMMDTCSFLYQFQPTVCCNLCNLVVGALALACLLRRTMMMAKHSSSIGWAWISWQPKDKEKRGDLLVSHYRYNINSYCSTIGNLQRGGLACCSFFMNTYSGIPTSNMQHGCCY